MMCNSNEADPFIIDITLMIAEQQLGAPPPPAAVKRKERSQLGLADLLEGQDHGQRNVPKFESFLKTKIHTSRHKYFFAVYYN